MNNNGTVIWLRFSLVGLMLLVLTYLLGYTVGQSDFSRLMSYYGLFFLTYIASFYYAKTDTSIFYLVSLGIVLRLTLVFAFPNLSDDIYRFIWDGRLINQGINPFNHLPTYFLGAEQAVEGMTLDLFEQLNSPDYYTIYPPVNQAIFSFACWLSPDSYYGSALIMKLFLFLFECGSIFLIIKLLGHFRLPLKNVILYALNPLIILEITGNLHFEGGMIFFLLLAIWLLVKTRNTLSAIAFALSIVSKLLPLMFLPFLIKRLGWKKSIRYFLILGITLLVCFSPLLNPTFFHNFANSLDLYFQKFEFNASIYYILRWLGLQLKGYNMISVLGPSLALVVLLSICYRAFKEQVQLFNYKNIFHVFLFAISIYVFLATTIHPWYVSMPLVLCIFTRFRFPILWSGLIMLTYINYSYGEYQENLWIVGLEYVLVFSFLVWELGQGALPFLQKSKLAAPPTTIK